jgi:hypothetical protein
MAQDTPFEMPHQLRELTERNFAQARGAYVQFLDAVAQTTTMSLGAMPFNEMTSSTKAIHERAILFAKQNVEACLAFASERANARDLQDVVAIQARYAQTQSGLCAASTRTWAADGRRFTNRAAQRPKPKQSLSAAIRI